MAKSPVPLTCSKAIFPAEQLNSAAAPRGGRSHLAALGNNGCQQGQLPLKRYGGKDFR
jgi:hypothetical protein